MAMTFQFNINPFGYEASPVRLGRMFVHSAGDFHQYQIEFFNKGEPQSLSGEVPKRMPDGKLRSGHRNFLHMLRDILNDADLDSLGEDYVHVLEAIQQSTGFKCRVKDYPDE